MEDDALLIGILSFKAIVYVLWCYIGVRFFIEKPSKPVPTALGLGFFRLCLSIFFGLMISHLSRVISQATVHWPGGGALTYFIVYLPIRWIEWMAVAVVMLRMSHTSAIRKSAQLWILEGMAISCLTDIPVLRIYGLAFSVGRIFC